MRSVIKEGWSLVRVQLYIVIILFLYRLLWGVFLYRFVQSAIIPLLLRYPDSSDLGQALFWIESQIALDNNSTVHMYLWILLGVALLRMLTTPFIRAGIYESLHAHNQEPGNLAFFRGMKLHWRSSLLYYAIETCLILLPVFWLVPQLYPIAVGAIQSPVQLLHLFPYAVAWFVYGWLIRQSILYMQFAHVSGRPVLVSLAVFLRRLLPAACISLLLGSSALLLFVLFGATAFIWTGLLALILQQAYHLVACLFRLWHIDSQYKLWQHHITEAA